MESFSMPLTPNQHAIWLEEQKYGISNMYNIGGYYPITGYIDTTVFKEAIQRVFSAADVCRASFSKDHKGNPTIHFAETSNFQIELLDFSSSDTAENDCLQWMERDFEKPFKQGERLVVTKLIKAGDRHIFWYFKFHHLLIDSWGYALFFQQVEWWYNHLTGNENSERVKPEIFPFAASIKPQLDYLLSEDYRKDAAYWKDKLNPYPSGLFSATASAITNNLQQKRLYKIEIPRKLIADIQKKAVKIRISNFQLWLGILSVWLFRHTAKDRFCIGMPVLNRSNSKEKNTIGLFAGESPLLLELNKDSSFSALLLSIKKTIRSDFRHQKLPIYDIFSAVSQENPAIHRLYDVIFSYESQRYKLRFGNSTTFVNNLRNGVSNIPLSFLIRDDGRDDDSVFIYLECTTTEFPKWKTELFQKELPEIIGKINKDFGTYISNLINPSEEELDKIYRSGLGECLKKVSVANIATAFEKKVSVHPKRLAIVYENLSITYQELNLKANQLANFLINQHQITREDIVALHFERSPNMAIAILAVCKAGAAWLPIDPGLPPSRKRFLLRDTQAQIVLATSAEVEAIKQLQLDELTIVNPEDSLSSSVDNPICPAKPTDLAYIIYTSGTSGQPKGVMIEQKDLLELSAAVQSTLYPIANKRWQLAFLDSCSFDASIQSLPGSLLYGHTIHIIPDYIKKDPSLFNNYLLQKNIDIIDCTPSYLQLLALANQDKWRNPKLRFVLAGGEALQPKDVTFAYSSLLQEDGQLVNLYGPTECTINTTYFIVPNPNHEALHPIPIGRPLPGKEVMVLNEDLLPVPQGVTGQICISGSGLARGYLNQSELTAKKFFPHPLFPKKRIYASGDMGYLSPEGLFYFTERKDGQVKIRGYRIEIGEIEAVLNQICSISRSIVDVKTIEGQKELVAYLLKKEDQSAIEIDKVRNFLHKSLPAYMVPRFIVVLEHLPLTISGKLDRSALPSPSEHQLNLQNLIQAENPLEEKIIEIWTGILQSPPKRWSDHFFLCGGNSLLAIKFVGLIEQYFDIPYPAHLLFSQSSLQEVREEIKRRTKNPQVALQSIIKNEKRNYYPASNGQIGLYLIQQSNFDSYAYNVPELLLLHFPIPRKPIEKAIQVLWERHTALRTGFSEKGGQIIQFLRKEKTPSMSILTVDKLDKKTIQQKLTDFFTKPFNLKLDTLFRVLLLERNAQVEKIAFSFHHIVTDGWSIEIIKKELSKLITYFSENKNQNLLSNKIKREDLLKIAVQYPDFTIWYNQLLQEHELTQRIHKFWKEQVKDIPEITLPGASSGSKPPSMAGRQLSIELDKKLFLQWKGILDKADSTIFIGFSAIVKTLLFRYTQQTDLTIGTLTSGRIHPDLNNTVGFFVNTLPLRSRINPEESFLDFLKKEKEAVRNVLDHQTIPFQQLVEKFHSDPQNPYPFFDFMITTEEVRNEDTPHKIISSGELPFSIDRAKMPMLFHFRTDQTTQRIHIEFQTERYKPSFINKMLGHLTLMMQAIVEDPTLPLYRLDYLDNSDKELVRKAIFKKHIDFQIPPNLAAAFVQQVEKTPNSKAIVFNNQSYTYASLNNRANQLAHTLIQSGLTGPEKVVAIQTERSPLTVIAIIAVLKTGSAWVPIDSRAPKERRWYMLEDSRASLLLTDAANNKTINDESFKKVPLLQIEESFSEDTSNPRCLATQNNLAYIIYTSGTTGKPKGVMIEQGSLLNEAFAVHQDLYAQFAPPLNIALLSSFVFDASVLFVPCALFTGHTIYFYAEFEKGGVEGLLDLFENHPIELVEATPTFYKLLLLKAGKDFVFPESMKAFIIGGEKLEKSLLEELNKHSQHPGIQYVNIYGPTETTISASCYRVNDVQAQETVIPIGFPFSNFEMFVLDKYLQPVPVGIIGQLFIAGRGVGRGYLNRPELNQQKYLLHPFKKEQRMYATGDQAILRTDGSIDFVGRMDQQIKIRGYRVELREIEEVLSNLKEVQQAVVIAYNFDGHLELIAYITLKQGESDPAEENLRQLISRSLPAYMVPAYWVFLAEIPLNSSGKPDKKALPIPKKTAMNSAKSLIPRSRIQEKLLEIWKQLLPNPPLFEEDSFFALGGQSIAVIALCQQIAQNFQLNYPIQLFYEKPSFAEMSALIEQGFAKADSGITPRDTNTKLILELTTGEKGTIFAFPPTLGTGFFYLPWREKFSEYSFYAFDFEDDKNIINHYCRQIKKIQSEGPYLLLGYSVGGNLAFEVALALEARKEKIAGLILIDTDTYDENLEVAEEEATEKAAEIIRALSESIELKESSQKLGVTINDPVHRRKTAAYILRTHKNPTKGMLQAGIFQLLSSDDIKAADSRLKWKNHTFEKLQTEFGYGQHSDMFDKALGDLNQEFILSKIEEYLQGDHPKEMTISDDSFTASALSQKDKLKESDYWNEHFELFREHLLLMQEKEKLMTS